MERCSHIAEITGSSLSSSLSVYCCSKRWNTVTARVPAPEATVNPARRIMKVEMPRYTTASTSVNVLGSATSSFRPVAALRPVRCQWGVSIDIVVTVPRIICSVLDTKSRSYLAPGFSPTCLSALPCSTTSSFIERVVRLIHSSQPDPKTDSKPSARISLGQSEPSRNVTPESFGSSQSLSRSWGLEPLFQPTLNRPK